MYTCPMAKRSEEDYIVQLVLTGATLVYLTITVILSIISLCKVRKSNNFTPNLKLTFTIYAVCTVGLILTRGLRSTGFVFELLEFEQGIKIWRQGFTWYYFFLYYFLLAQAFLSPMFVVMGLSYTSSGKAIATKKPMISVVVVLAILFILMALPFALSVENLSEDKCGSLSIKSSTFGKSEDFLLYGHIMDNFLFLIPFLIHTGACGVIIVRKIRKKKEEYRKLIGEHISEGICMMSRLVTVCAVFGALHDLACLAQFSILTKTQLPDMQRTIVQFILDIASPMLSIAIFVALVKRMT